MEPARARLYPRRVLPHRRLLSLALSLLIAGAGCGDDDPKPSDAGPDGATDAGPDDPPPPALFEDVEQTGRYEIPGLSDHAHVVRTEMDVPHVYAKDRLDAFRVLGFVMAKDRFFQMDMTRRLAQGTLTEVLGDAALESDIENRQIGGGYITDLFEEGLSDEEAAEVDAFAEGINAYVQAVRDRRIAAPQEYQLAYLLFELRSPADLMTDWTRRDVVATGSTVLYSTSFERGDVSRERAFDGADALFEGFPDEALRRQGLTDDVMNRFAPPKDSSSAAGWGLETTGATSAPIVRPRPGSLPAPRARGVELGMLGRLERRLDRVVARYHRDPSEGYGSNSWAVAGSATADGASLLAGDGHLQLSVPSLFWQYGIDTVLLGEAEETRMLGATIPGLPLMGVGTNGRVAWTQTAFFADVTDWYEEELLLDADGLPRATMFRGEEQPLRRVDEVFEVADVPALESVGRTETLARWTTFDGRWIASIEGREVTADETLGAGESRVNLMGDWIVPSDQDGDGKISAVSFYYGPFDGGTVLRAFRLFGLADDVEDYRQALRHFIGYGGAMTASDADGSVLHSAYHAVPCRDYLPRDGGTNRFVDGADPTRLIDGTQYGAWSIPLDDQGRVDEAAATTSEGCAVPFDQWPQALDPARQYVHHANNDPGNITTDDDLYDDPYYIGGPWIEGYRAARIEQRLEEFITRGDVTIEDMEALQGDHHSNLGEEWVPFLLEVIAAAREAAEGSPAADTPAARMAAAFGADQEAIEEVESRMTAWRDAGYPTPSGVETFYHTPAEGDAAHAVATMIFNAWFPRFVRGVLDDEGISSSLSPAATGDTFRMRTIKLLVNGRGADNPLALGSFDAGREESVFFDDVTTAEVESSEEMGLRALTAALAFLRSDPTEPGVGGFGTDDMSAWVWGLRHRVKFESLLADFLGDDPSLSLLSDMFTIDTSTIPLADDLPASDPRSGLTWFPRPGDQFDVDAANPGLGGERFTHGSGPVFRMVIALGPDGVRGQNIIPGGQSGLPASEHFDDQVRLWLANETIPMRYLPDEVAAGALSRERFAPAD